VGLVDLDGNEGEIRMLEKGASATDLRHFIRTRKLAPETAKRATKISVAHRAEPTGTHSFQHARLKRRFNAVVFLVPPNITPMMAHRESASDE
jgi:hypothetical protein